MDRTKMHVQLSVESMDDRAAPTGFGFGGFGSFSSFGSFGGFGSSCYSSTYHGPSYYAPPPPVYTPPHSFDGFGCWDNTPPHGGDCGGHTSPPPHGGDCGGHTSPPPVSPPPPATGTASLGGYVYLDNDFSGTKTDPDSGLSGVQVTLTNASGQTVATATTGADGSYTFANLPAGTYTISVAQLPNTLTNADGSTTPLFVGFPTLGSLSIDNDNGSISRDTQAYSESLDNIVVADGDVGTDYDFGVTGPFG